MPIDTPHPQYEARAAVWQRCRDALAGEDAIRAAGSRYLPWTGEPGDPDYSIYLQRAVWYGATERTAIGLAGAIARKATAIDAPKPMERHLEDIDLAGTDVQGFIGQLLQEQLLLARACVEVTMPAAGGEDRPYWVLWPAEAVLSWQEERRGGRMVTTRVVIQESVYEADPEDEYVQAPRLRCRELALVPAGAAEGVRMRVFVERQTRDGVVWVVEDEVWPTRRGELPPPFRMLGRPAWTAGAIVRHLQERQEEAKRQRAAMDIRIARLCP